MQLVFESGGRLTFQGGLEYYNPGRWELHRDQQELWILLPASDPDQLQIFKFYVGDGVKSFDPSRKQIVYHFDDKTRELNVGGWVYSKTNQDVIETVPEPVLK